MSVTQSEQPRWRRPGLAAVVILAAGAAVYANSLHGPFVFDDLIPIRENPNLRRWWPPWEAAQAPSYTSIAGRPLVAWSLAVNYAVGRLNVLGYHLVNVAIHLLTALTLFGTIHRLAASARYGRHPAPPPLGLALSTALIFVVHPLLTDANNQVVYRTETLMSLFYMLTLYCAIRCIESGGSGRWSAAAVVCCACGMASKENMVSAPVMVLLLDRCFWSPSVTHALRTRRGLYAGLASTWLILVILLALDLRDDPIGFHLPGLAPTHYWLTQSGVLLHYLRLVVWPDPLVVDYYDWPIARSLISVWPAFAAVILLAAATIWCVARRHWAGLAGALFFLLLAPTSVLPNAGEMAAEHRMYLPAAGVILLLVVAVWQMLHRLVRHAGLQHILALVILCGVVGAFAMRTVLRNRDYRSEVVLWTQTVRQRPGNVRALNNLGNALFERQRYEEADACFEEALALNPDYAHALTNIGRVRQARGHAEEALAAYRRALAVEPDFALAVNCLGEALLEAGQLDEAARHFRRFLELRPGHAVGLHNLGVVLLRQGRYREALEILSASIASDPLCSPARLSKGLALLSMGRAQAALAEFRQAADIDPQDADIQYHLGMAFAEIGRHADAMDAYRQALRGDPDHVRARVNLGGLYLRDNQLDAAQAHFLGALKIDPALVEAHNNLAAVCIRQGRLAQAVTHYRNALQIKPDFAAVHNNLCTILTELQRYDQAIRHGMQAARLNPHSADVHNNLANALLAAGRFEQAIHHYRQALAIDPQHPSATHNLNVATTRWQQGGANR